MFLAKQMLVVVAIYAAQCARTCCAKSSSVHYTSTYHAVRSVHVSFMQRHMRRALALQRGWLPYMSTDLPRQGFITSRKVHESAAPIVEAVVSTQPPRYDILSLEQTEHLAVAYQGRVDHADDHESVKPVLDLLRIKYTQETHGVLKEGPCLGKQCWFTSSPPFLLSPDIDLVTRASPLSSAMGCRRKNEASL